MQKITRFTSSFSAQAGADGWVLIRHEQSFAIYQGNLLHDPDMARYLGDAEYQVTLGLVDDRPCRLVRVKEQVDLPGLSWQGRGGRLGNVDTTTSALPGAARHLESWYAPHRFGGGAGEGTHLG